MTAREVAKKARAHQRHVSDAVVKVPLPIAFSQSDPPDLKAAKSLRAGHFVTLVWATGTLYWLRRGDTPI